jgi:threonine synthase
VAAQLGWDPPDRVVTSVGDGCILGGLHKGFLDAKAAGLIDRIPVLTGVQADGAAPLAHAFAAGAERPEDILRTSTTADSIDVGLPRDPLKALRAARATGGSILSVPDSAILDAIPRLARATGVFGEPAGVAGLAGLQRLRDEGALSSDERIVLMVTGNGLKDAPAGARAAGGAPDAVPPDMDRIAEALGLDG